MTLAENQWARKWDCCQDCGTTQRPHYAYGLCTKCYNRQRTPPLIICKGCSEEKPHEAHGLCRACYNHQKGREQCAAWRKKHPGYKSPLIICRECGKEKPHGSHGLCQICYVRQWRKNNPARSRETSRRRRALRRHATIESVNEQAVFALYNHACVYCGAKERLSLDHIIPLASGGPHAEDNLVVACSRCNSSKGSKPLADWLQTQPYAVAWVI